MSHPASHPPDPQPDPLASPGVKGQPPAGTPPAPPAPAPKRARRRRWPWILGAVLLVLIALIILAPTIASTAPVRSLVLGRVNQNLNGRVAVDDWSLGWLSGIRVSDLKVYDERNAEILHAPRITTGLSLLNAIRGRLDLGQTVVEVANIVVRVDENGRTNFDRLAKDKAEPADRAPDEPGELPDIRGNLALHVANGTITTVTANETQTIHIQPSTVKLDIPDINRAITNDVQLTYRVADDPAGTITAGGTIDAVENRRIDLERLSAEQKLQLNGVNLGALAPFVRPFVEGLELTGTVNGQLAVNAKGISGISADGELVVDQFLVGGKPMNGDRFQTERLALPVQITRYTDGAATILQVRQLGVQMPEATVAIVGQVPEQALTNVIDAKQPGATGDLRIEVRVDNVAAIANQLPNTLKLQEGVTLEGGTYAQVSTIAIQPESLTARHTLDLAAQGTNRGRPVRLSPIHLETELTAIPSGQTMPQLRDLTLSLRSAFATINGGGETLAAMNIKGNFDLDRLRQEVAQFADLGDVAFAGTGDFEIATSGDPTSEAEPIAANARLNVNNLTVAGIGERAIAQDRLAVVASGNLTRHNGAPALLEKGYLAITSGDPASPLLDLQANANVDLRTNTLPWFELAKLNVSDLPRAQQQFGGFVPALAEQDIQIREGQLYASAAGSFDGTTLKLAKPLAMSVPNLTVSKEGRALVSRETLRAQVSGVIRVGGGATGGELSDLSITTRSNLLTVNKSGEGPLAFALDADGALRGNGALTLVADIKRINDIAMSFGGTVVSSDQPQLRSGLFNGTVMLTKSDRPQTDLQFDGELTQLTVSSPRSGNALENERVTLALRAVVPDEPEGSTPVAAQGQISSSFAEATLADVRLLPAAGTWDMVQSAKVNARVPDLPKLYALFTALAPPAAPAQRAALEPDDRTVLFAALVQQAEQPVRGDEPISRPGPAPQRQPRPAPVPPAPPAPPAPAGSEPPDPLEITSGGATLALDITRDASARLTTVNLTDARISRLALRRGPRTYAFDREQPIALKLAAQVNAADDAERTLLQQIRSITITQLAGDLRIATLAMPQPIAISNLAAETPSASGAVRVEGELGRLTPLLSVLQGADPLPYSGAYVARQTLSTEGDQITLDGEIAATRFQVLDRADRNQVVFSEEKLTIRNAVTADQRNRVADIRALNISMASSGALQLDVKGKIERWGEQTEGGVILANARDIVAEITYDLEKVWPIVRPFVATAEDPMEEVAVAGKHQKRFTINGPYYEGELHEALRQLQVVGDLTVDRFVYPGIEVRELQIPVSLRRGVLETVYAGRPAAQRLPPPAAFNGGTLSIGNIRVDLTQPDPRITVPEKYRLVGNATINPLLGDVLGKYINPVFPNSERAQGLLDVTVVYAENVAIGEKLRSAQSGRARVQFSLTEMDIANPLGSLIFGQLTSIMGPFLRGLERIPQEEAETFRGSIRDAVITLENGVTTQDISLRLVDPGRPRDVIGARARPEATELTPMRFQGTVNLSDLTQSLTVYIPPGLFLRSDKDRENLARIFPQGIPLSMRGTTVEPKLDWGNITQRMAEAQLRGLLGGGGEGGTGGLLEDLLKRRERERDREREREPERRNR